MVRVIFIEMYYLFWNIYFSHDSNDDTFALDCVALKLTNL